MASPFIAAMNQTNHLQQGENGSAEYTASGVKESRVALFFALVRDLPLPRLQELLHTIARDGRDDADVIADLFLMAFQTRHCRGGKGERDLFYHMVLELAIIYPKTTASLMPIVPHFGSYKDWFQIIRLAKDERRRLTEQRTPGRRVKEAMTTIADIIIDLARDKLVSDRQIFDSGKPPSELSLLAKWAPREGKNMDKLAKELAGKIFPNSEAPKKEYRKLLSRLNTAIGTLEIKMCNKKWNTINFTKHVPSLSLMKYRKAFLNEVVNGSPPVGNFDETGTRHPTDEKRVACRKRLRETMMDKETSKLKGKQLFPHEIVQKLLNDGYRSQLSTLEKDIFSCQWHDIRNNVIKIMEKVTQLKGLEDLEEGKEDKKSGLTVDLGKMISLVDVSGSMEGTPMNVAIALGLLVSEIASPAYGNRCLTFSSVPTWVEFNPSMSLDEKVKTMKRAPWGMSTNFEAAMEKILEVAVKAKLSPEDIPDLIVFSDMQFNQASATCNSWETHHERIVRRFKEAGLKVCGKEWPAPHIVYWNLRGDTSGFPSQADTPGVTMLSGYSPSLMKLLLAGEPIEEDEEEIMEDGGVVRKKAKKDPYWAVRKALDSDDYDKVREILYDSNEGVLAKYVKKEEEEEEEVEKENGKAETKESIKPAINNVGEWEIIDEAA